METFDVVIKKDESDRLTIIEIPFDAKDVFQKPKGTILVSGTINDIKYRSRLMSRGNGNFIMVLDKDLKKSIGYDEKPMNAHITMTLDNLETNKEKLKVKEPLLISGNSDVFEVIKARQSIRKFTSEPVSEKIINTILYAGLCAPSAKNKRPYHFIVIRDKRFWLEISPKEINTSVLDHAPYSIIVCGDKNVDGMKELLYADCAAATQNMLLSIHGIGLGGVWVGVISNTNWYKSIIDKLSLPVKIVPISVIAFGWPDEKKELRERWDTKKIHYDKW